MKQNIDKAVAHLTEPTDTPAEMVAAGNKTIPAIKASPNYAGATDVVAATTAWETENTTLAQCNQWVSDCEANLGQARVDQGKSERRWKGRATGVTASITNCADGSKEIVGSFSLSTTARKPSPIADVPANPRPVRSKVAGKATFKWKSFKGNHGFMVQHGTDPNNLATVSAPIHSKKATFVLPDQTPGATLYFRVAACDARLPGGQTAYTVWVAVIVSA